MENVANVDIILLLSYHKDKHYQSKELVHVPVIKGLLNVDDLPVWDMVDQILIFILHLVLVLLVNYQIYIKWDIIWSFASHFKLTIIASQTQLKYDHIAPPKG